MRSMTVTAFARRFGLSRTTLLYYHRIGLLKPAEVSAAGYRLYGAREVKRMSRISAFREAGIPLKSIRAILDGEDPGLLEFALEQRLAALNLEVAQLRSQQVLVADLLQRKSGGNRERPVDVQQWVSMLEEAGVDAAGRLRWHQAFERDAPEAHQAFLQSLGLDAAEIIDIRRRSRQSPAALKTGDRRGDSDISLLADIPNHRYRSGHGPDHLSASPGTGVVDAQQRCPVLRRHGSGCHRVQCRYPVPEERYRKNTCQLLQCNTHCLEY